MEKEIKQERTVYRGSTLDEKLENVAICNKLLSEFESVHDDKIAKLSRDFLLKSHLETYIRNQLKLVDSRYQVLQNLLKEVTNKVTEIAEAHNAFAKKVTVAADFLKEQSEKLNEIVRILDDPNSEDTAPGGRGRRQWLEQSLKQVQALAKKNQDEGQPLVHAAMYAGEKALLSTPGGGRDVISMEMHDVQSKWDRFMSRVQEVIAQLDSDVLRAADAEASITKAKSWLIEQEQKLGELQHKKESGVSEEGNLKASLRRLSSLLQEVLSQEATIDSAERSAAEQPEQLQLKQRYDSLVGGVKDTLCDAQKRMDSLQDFNNACNDFSKWIAGAKEKLDTKGALVAGERESVASKLTIIKQLLEDEDGLEKLRSAARLCELAKSGITPSEGDSLDEQVNKMFLIESKLKL